MERIKINKNRGWRGLAEVNLMDDWTVTQSMVFSFSQPVWNDMQAGWICMQDKDNYIVINFSNTETLPKGQRSVLIKNFTADVIEKYIYPKETYSHINEASHYIRIKHFLNNSNNHTKSDWNYVGIRVSPII